MNAIRFLSVLAALSFIFNPAAGQKGFFKAIENNNIKKISSYISGGSDLNQTIVVKKKKTGMLALDTLNIRMTPLEYSVYYNYNKPDAVRLIAEKMNPTSTGYQTVLNNAFGISAWNENFEMSLFLLEKGADINSICSLCVGQSPIQTALDLSDFKLFYELKKRGARLDVRGINNQTLLHSAAAAGNEKIVGELLESLKEIDAIDDDGATPLLCAASEGHYNIFRLLEAKGADISIADSSGKIVMINAVNGKNDSLITYLISKGLANSGSDEYDRTPLLQACINNDFKIVKLLIGGGAQYTGIQCFVGDIYNFDEPEASPLTIAILNRNDEMAKYFLERMPEYLPGEYDHSVNKYIKDKSLLNYIEYGPFAAAVLEGNDTLINVLISRGFDLNGSAGNNQWDQWTPLMHACKNNDLRMVRFLVDKGAWVRGMGENNESPFSLAVLTGNVDLVKFLFEKDKEVIFNYDAAVLRKILEKNIKDKAFVKALCDLRDSLGK
jgi:ankyrin repeat protein